jgi:hypothetical protein
VLEESVGLARNCKRHHLRVFGRRSCGEYELAMVVLDGLRIERHPKVLVDKPLNAQIVTGEVERVFLYACVRLRPLQQAERSDL